MPERWDDQETPALAIVAQGDQILEREHGEEYIVQSQSNPGTCYCVDPEGSCECEHHQQVGRDCIHILATRYYLELKGDTSNGQGVQRVEVTRDDSWAAYNQAQGREVELFDRLLADLTQSIPEPDHDGPGRPPLPVSTEAFCAVLKVYSQLSSRRAQSLYRRAAEKDLIPEAPHFNAVTKFLNREDATEVLRGLLARTARVFRDVETKFAVDSTGFTSRSFGAYCQGKHGDDKDHEWRKLHVISGVKTNVVTAAHITDPTGEGTGDVTHFEPLVRATAEQGFEVEDVMADKAYSSRDNHKVCEDLGGRAVIPFKSNATSKAKGTFAWTRAYHFFSLNEEEFEEAYHRRSNVESTIGAVKEKFGESLKSRNRRAQQNELLCKLIAYNITVVIRWLHRAGIATEALLGGN